MTNHKYESSKEIFPLIGFPKCGPLDFFMESFYVDISEILKNKPDRKKNIFKKNGKNMIDMSEMMVMAKMGDDFFFFLSYAMT